MPGWGGGEAWSGVRIHPIHPASEKGKGKRFSPSSWPHRHQPEPQQTSGVVLEHLRTPSSLKIIPRPSPSRINGFEGLFWGAKPTEPRRPASLPWHSRFFPFPPQKTIESERQKLLSDFEGLRQFLHDQEHILLGQLEKMEKGVSKRQNENITDLSKEITLLNKLITELEEKIQQPMLEFLKVRAQVLVLTLFLIFSMCLWVPERCFGG